MSFNLGLEALAEHDEVDMSGDMLSYEFLDTVVQFNAEASEAVVIADGISSLCSAYENIMAVCDVLEQYGNTPALEALIGGNFREGFSLEAAAAAKDGLWAKFVKWLKTLWAKIKAFFAKFFTSADAMIKKLRERAQELGSPNVEMPEVEIELPKPSILSGINNDILKQVNEALGTAGYTLKQLNQGAKLETEAKKAEEFDAFIKAKFGKAGEKVKVGKDDAIKMLTQMADHLQALKECKAEVDKVCADLERSSFQINEGDVQGVAQQAREDAKAAGENKKKQNEAASNAETVTRYLGSDDRRTTIMKVQSAATKLIKDATTEAIRRGSVCLSAFKAQKVSK